jgi:hypothetical protein
MRAPIDLVRPDMLNTQLEWLFGNHVYVIEFRKPDII